MAVTKKFSVKVDGLEEVLAAVVALDPAAQTRIKLALREVGKALRREMRSRVPRASGAFRKAIRSKFTRDKLTMTTGAMKKNGRAHPLAHIIEFGTAPHALAPKNKKAMKLEEGFAASAQHPGTPAQPFLVPGFEATRATIETAMREALGLAIEDAQTGRRPQEPSGADDDS
jgi:HK97 gp10 family phage protein